ncbi:hypothetical protein PIB30_075269 [Stylosanthes scabra]|uniref:Transmembrane protein n=1 Tax=Stylosanthes scabra TaxID=79078 RepID=A0ABU6SQ46_9FABA|nr:hypothetical protein [Stylosanthes scabra]
MSNRSVKSKNRITSQFDTLKASNMQKNRSSLFTLTLGSFTASQLDRRRLSSRHASASCPVAVLPHRRPLVCFVFVRGSIFLCLSPPFVLLRPPPSYRAALPPTFALRFVVHW